MDSNEQQPGGPQAGGNRQAQIRRVVFGSMLVVAGVVLILNHLAVFAVFGLWPLLLVGLGLNRLLISCCAHCRRSGWWLLGIGSWFALNEFTTLSYHHTWPLLLVIVGALVMWDAVAPTSRCAACAEGHHAG